MGELQSGSAYIYHRLSHMNAIVGPMMTTDAQLLQAALLGYQAERDRIDKAIADIKKRIGKGGADVPTAFPAKAAGRRGRTMSAEARERIAIAQRKRWANWHKSKKTK